MGWVLLGACVVVCPLLMGAIMLSMRHGSSRRPRLRRAHHENDREHDG